MRDEFVACFNPENRHQRPPTWSEEDPKGRCRRFAYDKLVARDKVNLDIFWLRDESLEDTATTRPIRTCWLWRLWRICRPRWSSSARLRRIRGGKET